MELEEVLVDIEITLNTRPLSYAEDDVQMPILPPHAMIVWRPKLILEDTELDGNEKAGVMLRKRGKHVLRCKDVWWSIWSAEYLNRILNGKVEEF